MMLKLLIILCIGMNLITFALMGYDKSCAKCGAWRIPEKVLFLAAGCMGALGGIAGIRFFRHKTKHTKFVIGFPILLVLQLLLLILIFGKGVGFC